MKKFFNLFKKQPEKLVIPPAVPKIQHVQTEVAGTTYHWREMAKLVQESPRWKADPTGSRRIYQYRIADYEADLIPEPTNQHDPNAVRVEVQGLFIGYIPASETELKELIKKGKVESAMCKIYKGPYKYLDGLGFPRIQSDYLEAQLSIAVRE